MGFLMHLLSLVVVVVAVAFTIFTNYPAPPPSPLLYQWRSTGHNFSFGKYNVFYKDEQRNANEINGSVLLCIHGFPTSSLDWYKVWPDLKRKFSRVIAPDLLGLGFSDKPRYHDYPIKQQADLIESLLRSVAVSDVHILAHDYGDTVTQELLARFNEGSSSINILSVCLTNGGIFPSLHHPNFAQRALRWPLIGTVLAKWSNKVFFRKTLSSVFGPDNEPTSAEFHDMWSVIRTHEGHRVSGEILSYIDQRFTYESRWLGALQNYKRPLNLIYGPADPINPPPYDDHFRKVVPNGNVDVLSTKVGHYPQLEDPENLLKFYFSFLKRNHLL